jgi:hypothetical protein
MAKAEPRSITRRSLVAALALPVVPAVPVLAPRALPLPVCEADPVFAAIEAHIVAYREFNTVLDALAVAEQAAWHAPRGQRRAANRRLRQAHAAERRLGDLESEAVERMVATVPQTLHGAAALLAYVRGHSAQGCPMCEEDSTMVLLGSIECAICRAAGLPVPSL